MNKVIIILLLVSLSSGSVFGQLKSDYICIDCKDSVNVKELTGLFLNHNFAQENNIARIKISQLYSQDSKGIYMISKAIAHSRGYIVFYKDSTINILLDQKYKSHKNVKHEVKLFMKNNGLESNRKLRQSMKSVYKSLRKLYGNNGKPR